MAKRRRASGIRARTYKKGPQNIYQVAEEFKALAADFLIVQDAALRAVSHAVALADMLMPYWEVQENREKRGWKTMSVLRLGLALVLLCAGVYFVSASRIFPPGYRLRRQIGRASCRERV